ncbi:unnamed protein product, partial [Hymenolepis diminuta]
VSTLIRIVLSLSISARTAIRADKRKDSARAVNDDSIQVVWEAFIGLIITRRMAY